MFLTKIKIYKYRLFENLEINLGKNDSFPSVFSIASVNGGGKSTLLQFIFTMLHCFMDDEKKKYIKNLLENENLEEDKLARFEISIDGKDCFLEFLTHPVESEAKNFNLFLDIKDIKKSIESNRKNIKQYEKLMALKQLIEKSNRVTPTIKMNFRNLETILERPYLNSETDDKLYRKARTSDNIDDYKNFINMIIENNDLTFDNQSDLGLIYDKTKNDLEKLKNILKEESLLYVTHLNNDKVLLLKSNMDNNLLKKLSSKVFLTAPNSQVFLFLSQKDKQKIFHDFNDYNKYDSYEDVILSTKGEIDGFFTYDFVATETILKAFDKAFMEDRKNKIKTGKYGNNYDNLEQELNNFLEDKTISVNDDLKGIKFKNYDKELSPEDLSHGELKKLSIYIWLKYLVEEDSIVLMDELDIALHPSWQYEIVKELSKWSKNTQFFLATHSPQILSSTHYKNLIVLDKQDGISTAKQLNQAPLDRDINTILKIIMGADYIPQYLEKLHDEYRELIEDGKINTKEAEELKVKLLEYESENSSFFQGIYFDLELME